MLWHFYYIRIEPILERKFLARGEINDNLYNIVNNKNLY